MRVLLPLLAALVVFAADTLTPLGVAVPVGYVIVVALGIRGERVRDVFLLAAVTSVLGIVALPLKTAGAVPWSLILTNRGLALVAIWTVAGLVAGGKRRAMAALQAEQAKRRAAALFESVIGNVPDGIFLVEPSGRIQIANPAAHRIFGYAPGELIGRGVDELLPNALRPQHAERRGAFGQPIVALPMAQGRVVRALRKDGAEIAVEGLLAPAGVGDLVLASVRDVTERQRYEERHRAAQRLEAIGRLAGGIAHDFNNLLAVILSCADFVGRDPRSAHATQDLDDIMNAARRGADLTKQLLAFSRRQIIAPRRVDVNGVIRDMGKMLERILGEDVDVSTSLSSDPFTVEVDPSQLEQILLNLVVNARDAMPKGGKLTIETGNVTLDERYAGTQPDVTPGDYVMIAVSDTGAGMTEEVRLRVFEPFFTTKGPAQGTGLGLATVYGIVKQANGHIWVYSEPGRGTTFKVYLPRASGEPELLATIHGSSRPKGGSERVMVVEDEPAVRRVLVRMLRDAGYEVLEAGNGLDALKKVETLEGELDLVMTDVVMPQMGGREVAERIAAKHPRVKVMFLSGYTENAIVHRGVLDPGLVFVAKPFQAADLLRRVRELLDAG